MTFTAKRGMIGLNVRETNRAVFLRGQFGMYRLNKSSGLKANQKQICKFKIPLLVLLAICFFCQAAEARTDIYSFLSDRSKVVQTGGFAGVHETYSVEGRFRLSVDFDAGTAWFDKVDANLIRTNGFVNTESLGVLFNMTELVGTIVDDDTIRFEGEISSEPNIDSVIELTFDGENVYLVGEIIPPACCDFFYYNLDAVARKKFAGGTGEPNDPFQIATAQQLISIGDDPNLLDKHFILINDIDLDPNLPGGRVFTHAVIAYDTNDIVGFQGTTFDGSFDGNGYKINNLTIHNDTSDFLGLFGRIESNSSIRNLGLKDVSIVGSSSICVGALAGSSAGNITNCYATGKISGGYDSENVGGLIGANSGAIIDCHTSGNVSSGKESRKIGGLAGFCFNGVIKNCHTDSNVTSGESSYWIGGLVGHALEGTIIRCYVKGSILGGDNSSSLGGLVGGSTFGIIRFGSRIDNCFATADVTGGGNSNNLGGLIGSDRSSKITNCYATGCVSGGGFIGGLVGEASLSMIKNCYTTSRKYYNGEISEYGGLIGFNSSNDLYISQCFWDIEATGASNSYGGKGLTTAQMQNTNTYLRARWDMVGERANGTADIWRIPESGGYPELAIFSEEYQPHTLAGAGTPDNPYKIASAEDLGAIHRHDESACYKLMADIDLAGITWNTSPVTEFDGSFDGNSHRIINLSINSQTIQNIGLFGNISSNGRIQNLGLDNVLITGLDNSKSLGGLAGESSGDINNCYVTGRISSGNESVWLGLLVGANSGNITNCYAIGSMSFGNYSGVIGGLVGSGNDGSIINCYAATSISYSDSSSWLIGGLLGTNWWDKMIITESYFLVSSNGGGPDNGEGGIPLTNDQMKQQDSFVNWDFDDIWMICEGIDYPRLQWQNIQCEE